MKKKILLTSLFALSLFALPLTSCGENEAPSDSSSSAVTATLSIKAPSKSSLEVGESITLECESTSLPAGATINWFSSNETVASITQKGKINALAVGTTEITCKSGEVTSASLLITVTPKKVPSLSIKASKAQIEVNEKITLDVTIKDTDETDVQFVADNDCVTISSNGEVTGVKEGVSKIHATLGNLASNEITIAVLPESRELTVSITKPSKKYLLVDETLTLTSEVKGNINHYPLEFISSNPSVLSVSTEGVVTAISVGTASVTLKVKDVSSSPVEFTVLSEYSAVESVTCLTTSLDMVQGETHTFSDVTILPETANQTFSLESSNPTVVSTDGNLISAKKAGTATITISAGTKSCTVSVTVASALDTYVPTIKAMLETANEKEATLAKSGHFYLQDQDTTGKDTTYDKYDFTVYSGNRSVARHKKKSTYSSSNKNERISFTLCNNDLIQYTESYDDDNNLTGTPDITKKDVVDNNASYGEVTNAIAANVVTHPYVGAFSTSKEQAGFAKYVLDNYFGSSYFGTKDSESKDTFQYSKANDVYTLKMDSISASSKNSIELNLKFESELLVSVTGRLTKRSLDYDYDLDKDVETLKGYTLIDGALESGAREAATDLYDPDSLYLSDFDAQFYTGYDSNKKIGTEFAPDEYVYFEFINTSPSTYNSDVDTGYLTFDEEHADKITSYGTVFKVSEPIDDLAVTVHTAKNLEKTYHLRIAEQVTKTLAYSGSTKMVAGDALSSKITFDKNNATEIVYSITSDNADKATITKVSTSKTMGYETFTFTATEAGTYSIKAHDNKSGLEAAQDIVVYENSDAGVLSYLEQVQPVKYGTIITQPALAKQTDGSFVISMNYTYQDDLDDDVTENLSAKLTYADGAFTVSDATTSGEVKITSVAFGSGHSKLKITFSDYQSYNIDIK